MRGLLGMIALTAVALVLEGFAGAAAVTALRSIIRSR
jgi:hypothetical protein